MAEPSREERVKRAREIQAQKVDALKKSVYKVSKPQKVVKAVDTSLPKWKQDLLQNEKYAPYIVPNLDGLMVMDLEACRDYGGFKVPTNIECASIYVGEKYIVCETKGEKRARENLDNIAKVRNYLGDFKPFPDNYELVAEKERFKLIAQLGKLYDTQKDHIANQRIIMLQDNYKHKILNDLSAYYPKEEDLLKKYVEQINYGLNKRLNKTSDDFAIKVVYDGCKNRSLVTPKENVLQKITGKGLNKEQKAMFATFVLQDVLKAEFDSKLERDCLEYFTKNGVSNKTLTEMFDRAYTSAVFVKIAHLKGLKVDSAIRARNLSKKNNEQQRTR